MGERVKGDPGEWRGERQNRRIRIESSWRGGKIRGVEVREGKIGMMKELNQDVYFLYFLI